MAFENIAMEAKKVKIGRVQTAKFANYQKPEPRRIGFDDDDSSSNAPVRVTAERQDISNTDTEVTGFVPQARTFGSRSSSDPKHGSIIRNIATQSNSNQQSFGDATWVDCKHRKADSGRDFCREYHSLCAKDRCRRAKR
ncbi:MAG: hypothetical protein WCI04_01550 [archaeon]